MKLSMWNIIGFSCVFGWLLGIGYVLIVQGFWLDGSMTCVVEPITWIANIEVVLLFVGLVWLLGMALRSEHGPSR